MIVAENGNCDYGDVGQANIHRVPKSGDSPFVQVDKEMLENRDLSWEAKGVLAFMLGRPNDWRFYQNELRKHGAAGRDKFQRILKELELFGYLRRTRRQDEHGKWRWEWEVYESPSLNPNCACDASPCTENPATVFPLTVHPSTVHPSSERAAIYQELSVPTITKQKMRRLT